MRRRSAGRLAHDPNRELAELRDYLGDRYEHSRLVRWEQQLDEEFDACGDEAAFYRSSEGYLYNLTVFAMSGTKLPYLRRLTELVPPRSRLLDYGCGIGSDGLLLLEAGYRVEFADFDNPSTAYLRWRLARRGLDAPVHDLDREVPGGFDGAFAFDVIEHVEDPFALLAEMERRANLVMVNLLEPLPGETDLHRELPLKPLVRHAAERGLAAYSIHHGRSHLIAYRSEGSTPASRLRGRLRQLTVEARHRLRGAAAGARRRIASARGQHAFENTCELSSKRSSPRQRPRFS